MWETEQARVAARRRPPPGLGLGRQRAGLRKAQLTQEWQRNRHRSLVAGALSVGGSVGRALGESRRAPGRADEGEGETPTRGQG